MTVKAFDPSRRTNAQAIAEFASLGMIGASVLDMTHATGRFWRTWQPKWLVASDVNGEMPINVQADAQHLPFRSGLFDSVVFDPPYKLNGAGGSCAEDASYGVADSWTERAPLYRAGLAEALRVCKPKGTVIVKFQDQIAGGKMAQQLVVVANAMREQADLIGQLHVLTTREQPEGRRQASPRNNYSTMQCWRRTK